MLHVYFFFFFGMCFLSKAGPITPIAGRPRPREESALSKVTQLGKGKDGTRTTWFSAWPRASLAIYVSESLLSRSQSSLCPEPLFLHLEWLPFKSLSVYWSL